MAECDCVVCSLKDGNMVLMHSTEPTATSSRDVATTKIIDFGTHAALVPSPNDPEQFQLEYPLVACLVRCLNKCWMFIYS